MKSHTFEITTTWTGANGVGTTGYTEYSRDYDLQAQGKEVLHCSTDPAFRGDGTKYNPEDMLVGALSSCHMLWYFHLCADAGIVVLEYTDHATGTMVSGADGGRFTDVVLKPVIKVQSATMIPLATELHDAAHKKCFIANSVNFPVTCVPTIHAI
jgi:organic hydroperoxide reductase OsmC/OhrA